MQRTRLTLPIKPVPLARPRVTRFGTFLPKTSKDFRDQFQTLARAAYNDEPLNSPFTLSIEFFRPMAVTAKTYGDIDNLAKAVLDAGTGILWTDDRFITQLICTKFTGKDMIIVDFADNPRRVFFSD